MVHTAFSLGRHPLLGTSLFQTTFSLLAIDKTLVLDYPKIFSKIRLSYIARIWINHPSVLWRQPSWSWTLILRRDNLIGSDRSHENITLELWLIPCNYMTLTSLNCFSSRKRLTRSVRVRSWMTAQSMRGFEESTVSVTLSLYQLSHIEEKNQVNATIWNWTTSSGGLQPSTWDVWPHPPTTTAGKRHGWSTSRRGTSPTGCTHKQAWMHPPMQRRDPRDSRTCRCSGGNFWTMTSPSLLKEVFPFLRYYISYIYIHIYTLSI